MKQPSFVLSCTSCSPAVIALASLIYFNFIELHSLSRFSPSKDVPEGWEKFKNEKALWRFLHPLEDDTPCIVLRSHHNKWLCAEDDELTITNNRTEINRWEQFEIDEEDGFIGLKTWKGKYLSAQPDGTLEANRDDLNAWEKFELFMRGDENIAFRSAHGKWLSAQPDGTMELNRDNLDIWETFYGWKEGTVDEWTATEVESKYRFFR